MARSRLPQGKLSCESSTRPSGGIAVAVARLLRGYGARHFAGFLAGHFAAIA
jgi:hypothetical protein